MKKTETEFLTFVIFGLSTFCGAVLTGYEYQDITANRKFGCHWEGGSVSAVICACREEAEEMLIEKSSIPSYQTSKIEINNCKKVHFGSKSISEMRNLRNIHLNNIEHIIFESSSLHWYGYREHDYDETFDLAIPSLKINIENSYISKMSSYTFEGRINEIQFNNVTINEIEPFAFTSLRQTQNIIIKNSKLNTIRLQPFKKFSTENLELNGVQADLVPSRFFSNITVYNKFEIKNCNFYTVRPGAFLIYNPKIVNIIGTKIQHLDGEAFKIITRGNVLFKNNEFDIINDGAFQGIKRNLEETDNTDLTITFESNVFKTISRDSLRINDLSVQYYDLRINTKCDCKSIDHKIKDNDFYTQIKCLYNNEYVTVKEYKANMCSIIASYSTTIIIICVVLVLCIIIGFLLVIYFKKVHNSRQYGNEKQTAKGNLSLIVPDGRTYRETELHVIVERADLLTTDL